MSTPRAKEFLIKGLRHIELHLSVLEALNPQSPMMLNRNLDNYWLELAVTALGT